MATVVKLASISDDTTQMNRDFPAVDVEDGDLLVVVASGPHLFSVYAALEDSASSYSVHWYVAKAAWFYAFDGGTKVLVRTTACSAGSITVRVSGEGYSTNWGRATLYAIRGMALYGSSAVKQVAGHGGPTTGGSGTPTYSFGAACLPANPVIATVMAEVGGLAVTPPSGFTDQQNTSKHDATTRNGGFSGTAVTWGGSASNPWLVTLLELDTTGGEAWEPPPRPFVSVNGLGLDVEYGTWKEERIPIGALTGIALSGQPGVSQHGTIRRWSGRLTPSGVRTLDGPVTPSAVNLAKLIRWIEGQGQSWNFDSASHSYSGAGFTNSVTGAFTRGVSGGRYGGGLKVTYDSVFGVDMRNKLGVSGGWTPALGWTLMCHREFQAGESVGSGWHHVILTGAVAFSRGSAANPTGVTQYVDGVAGSYSLGRCFSVLETSPYVGLHGYLTTNSTADVDFDDWAFLPFSMPAEWIEEAAGGMESNVQDFAANGPWPALPRVALGGIWVDPEDSYVRTLALGRVKGAEVVQIVDSSEVKQNIPLLDVEFLEWVDD